MRPEHLTELREKNFLTEDQYSHLEAIASKKIFSVYYELRIMLYLGVVLFTTGVGLLIYQNIGELGHILSIIALFILTVACFIYVFRNALPYTHGQVKAPTPYFDYVVLLGCLLFISVLGYLQFQFSILNEALGETTLVTAIFFFYAAYRFDHVGVLSLSITALASFWSISVSPQKWYSNEFIETANLHITAVIFGAAVAGVALTLDKKAIKKHFTFTYLNFCSLIFLTGALAGVFINDDNAFYFAFLLVLYLGCGLTAYYAHQKKSFLFLLYAFVFAYIGTTYFLTDVILNDPYIWFFYLIGSCGGFIYFIVRYKRYFKRAE